MMVRIPRITCSMYMRCEQQNIPLRDHKDSGSEMDILRDETASHGNSSALLKSRVEDFWKQSLQGTYLYNCKNCYVYIHLPASRIS